MMSADVSQCDGQVDVDEIVSMKMPVNALSRSSSMPHVSEGGDHRRPLSLPDLLPGREHNELLMVAMAYHRRRPTASL